MNRVSHIVFTCAPAFLLLFSGPANAAQKLPEKNWGLENLAAKQAQQLSHAQRPVLIAVIDTGMDVKHPELREQLWINSGEYGVDQNGQDKSKNQKDDDHNGYVDDLHGWNFAAHNSDLTDKHGHGTHVAGLIAGRKTGINPEARLMILKFYETGATQKSTLESTVQAINYAIRMKADIINFSGGGTQPNLEEKQAVQRAGRAGILFVAAAGNERSNSDRSGYYPAGYEFKHILSVAAVNEKGELPHFSNFGSRSVDLAAPGADIWSARAGSGFDMMSGTSQATALATGVASLVLANSSQRLLPETLIRQLALTGAASGALKNKTRFGVQLNAHRALVMKDEHTTAMGLRVKTAPELPSELISSH